MSSIPTYSTVSIEQIIARVKIQVRCADSTEWDSYFNIMIMEGLGHLNALSQLIKKQCQITVTDGKSELPKDLIRFLALRGKCREYTAEELEENPALAQTSNWFNGGLILYADTTFLSNCGCNTNGWNDWINTIQINNGYIHFNNHTTIETATLAYLGLNVDKDGVPLIYERYERALASYASWRYTQMYAEKFNQYLIDGYRAEWAAQAARIKGEDVARDFQNDKVLINQLVATLLVPTITNALP